MSNALNAQNESIAKGWRRRVLLGLGVLLAAPLLAQAAPPAKATKPAGVRELKWEELVPPGWDPTKTLRSKGDLARLQDGDPKTSALMREVREVWDNAPTRPELAGQRIAKTLQMLKHWQGTHALYERLEEREDHQARDATIKPT